MSLPLLTTNSLPGSGQFPLCWYNLFGFQVLHGIKNNLLSGGVWVVFAFRQDALFLCVPEGHLWTDKAPCVGDGDWRVCLGLEGAPSRLSDLPRDSQQTRIESPRCVGYCARRQGCSGEEMDRIPALIWTGERHTPRQINKGDSFRP